MKRVKRVKQTQGEERNEIEERATLSFSALLIPLLHVMQSCR